MFSSPSTRNGEEAESRRRRRKNSSFGTWRNMDFNNSSSSWSLPHFKQAILISFETFDGFLKGSWGSSLYNDSNREEISITVQKFNSEKYLKYKLSSSLPLSITVESLLDFTFFCCFFWYVNAGALLIHHTVWEKYECRFIFRWVMCSAKHFEY